MSKDKNYYMVMSLRREVILEDQISGERSNYALNGIAGYIPVYDTYEEALQNSGNKYRIMVLKEDI